METFVLYAEIMPMSYLLWYVSFCKYRSQEKNVCQRHVEKDYCFKVQRFAIKTVEVHVLEYFASFIHA